MPGPSPGHLQPSAAVPERLTSQRLLHLLHLSGYEYFMDCGLGKGRERHEADVKSPSDQPSSAIFPKLAERLVAAQMTHIVM